MTRLECLTQVVWLDTVERMPIPQPTVAHESTLITTLGFRAVWLHLQLSGPAAAVHCPRDREILTLVATRPSGMTLDDLTHTLHRFGCARPAAAHRIRALADEGFLALSVHDGQSTVDLPPNDLDWIASQTASTNDEKGQVDA